MATSYSRFVIARPQWFIDDSGRQFTQGFDQATVVGEGRTLRAAARKSGGWETMPGYRVFDGTTGKCLGKLSYNSFNEPEVFDI